MKLAHFFLDVDMRCGHDGLMEIVRKKKIQIKEDDFIVFMNTSRTIIKMFCGSEEAILHYKKEGRVIDPGIIKYMPKFCGGKQLNMDGALREHIQDVLKRRQS